MVPPPSSQLVPNCTKMVTSGNLTEECKLTWSIPNFDLLKSSKEVVNAQKISFEMGHTIGLPVKLKWYLGWNDFTPWNEDEDDEEDEETIGIYLSLDGPVPRGVTEVMAWLDVQVKNKQEGDYWRSSTTGYRNLMEYSGGWGFDSFIIPEFVDTAKLDLTADGSLPIHLTVCLTNLRVTPELLLSSVAKLADLSTILKSDDPDPQVKILSKEGKPIHVSRAILRGRSPYFQDLFLRKELELQRKEKCLVIKFENFSEKSLVLLLTYLHTGTMKSGWSQEGVIEEVVYGADKFKIEELKHGLDGVLGKVCTIENCGKLLGLAKKLGMKTAEVELLQFFEGKLRQLSTQEVAQFLKESNSDNPFGWKVMDGEMKVGKGSGPLGWVKKLLQSLKK